MNDNTMTLVYIVCKDTAEAKGIGRNLLERRLVACVNILPIESAYWWEGQITEDKEAVLIAKTVARNFEVVKDAVLALHSYTTPCVLSLPVVDVEADYRDWLKGEIL